MIDSTFCYDVSSFQGHQVCYYHTFQEARMKVFANRRLNFGTCIYQLKTRIVSLFENRFLFDFTFKM